jgi:thioredoxin 1
MHDRVISSGSGSFETDVLAAATPVVVEFTASWCAPCRRLAPILSELAGRHAGRVGLVVVDVEAEPDLAQAWRVTSMPTLLGFRGGRVVAQQVGFSGRAPIERLFAELAAQGGDEVPGAGGADLLGAGGAAGSGVNGTSGRSDGLGGRNGSGTTTLKP